MLLRQNRHKIGKVVEDEYQWDFGVADSVVLFKSGVHVDEKARIDHSNTSL